MKNLLKKLSVVFLSFVLVLALVACGGGETPEQPEQPEQPEDLREYVAVEDYQAYSKVALEDHKKAIGDLSAYAELQAGVQAAYEAGIAAIDSAESIKAVEQALENAPTKKDDIENILTCFDISEMFINISTAEIMSLFPLI